MLRKSNTDGTETFFNHTPLRESCFQKSNHFKLILCRIPGPYELDKYR